MRAKIALRCFLAFSLSALFVAWHERVRESQSTNVFSRGYCDELPSAERLSLQWNDSRIRRVSLPQGSRSSTFLLGIFSKQDDVEQRAAIRQSYLSLHEENICALYLYLTMDNAKQRRCVILYAFVVGGNPNGPTFRNFETASTLILSKEKTPHDAEDDVIYLDIRENMEDGKTPTWFAYAADLSVRHTIDYISKVDSDTFLHIPALLRLIERDLPPKPTFGMDSRKRYGGVLREFHTCGGVHNSHCFLLQGRVYMSGQFYFVSSDLAIYISSEAVMPQTTRLGIEDFDFGMWVFSHPEAINLVVISGEMVCLHDSRTKDSAWWQSTEPDEVQFPYRSPELLSLDSCPSLRNGDWRKCQYAKETNRCSWRCQKD